MLSLVLWFAVSAVAEDAPVAEPAAVAEPAPAVITPSVEATPAEEPVGWDVQYSAGAVAALVAVPVSLYLGEWLGSLSNSLIWSAIPVLLSIGLIPPIAVTAATVIVGNWNTPGRYRWWPALIATTVVNGASLAIGASLGLSVGMVGRVIVYTLAQAVLQPGIAVGIERAWPRTESAVITLRNEPVSPSTFFVPTSTWSF